MTFRTCSFEQEVLQALRAGHWPNGCAPELRAHVESCSSCGDLVLVTHAFQVARSESVRQDASGSASLLWWRAQLRRRYAATERVSRPITIAQTFAMLLTLLVAVVFVASQYHHGLHWATWWHELAPTRFLHLSPNTSSNTLSKPDWNLLLIIPGLGVLALLGGVVAFLASEKS
jgi:hypothetical protein